MMKIIEICDYCSGSGLARHIHNHNVSARNHHRYVVCEPCKGEGKPPEKNNAVT